MPADWELFPFLNSIPWKEEIQCYYYSNNAISPHSSGKGWVSLMHPQRAPHPLTEIISKPIQSQSNTLETSYQEARRPAGISPAEVWKTWFFHSELRVSYKYLKKAQAGSLRWLQAYLCRWTIHSTGTWRCAATWPTIQPIAVLLQAVLCTHLPGYQTACPTALVVQGGDLLWGFFSPRWLGQD